MKIHFNKPYQTPNELKYLAEAVGSGKIAGNNQFCQRVCTHLREKHNLAGVFLTPSGTAALEMGAWLAGLGPGDEVILPSYTFSSTANAVVMTGAKPVFCEVDPTTMNADASHMASLVSKRTRMLLPIDYAGLPCDAEAIQNLADKHDLVVMVDAAQSYASYHKGKACGSFGDLATFSFHETKNISCGEGGALIVNRDDWVERAHFLQEKGTDRRLVLYGQKTKYHWVDIGSSYLLSDILAAVLLGQLEEEDSIMSLRGRVTSAYNGVFAEYCRQGAVRVTPQPGSDRLNSHAYWVVFATPGDRESFLLDIKEKDVYAYIGYLPLHSAPMGMKYGYRPEDLPLTQDLASRIVRLPLYAGLAEEGLDYCVDVLAGAMRRIYG